MFTKLNVAFFGLSQSLQARVGCGAARAHGPDQHSIRHRQLSLPAQVFNVATCNAEAWPLHRTISHQFRNDPFRDVHRDREANAC